MKFFQNIFGSKQEEEYSEIKLTEPSEFQQQQWSALYLTNMETSLSELKIILGEFLEFKDTGIFETVLAPNNKISVLNAINPGIFSNNEVTGIVVLINATSFSEYADKLLQELYRVISVVAKHNPGVSIGESPQQNFSTDELESWLKNQRDRYFFID